MPARHPESHYYGGRLKPWWRKIQRAEERAAAEAEQAAAEAEQAEEQDEAESE